MMIGEIYELTGDKFAYTTCNVDKTRDDIANEVEQALDKAEDG